MTEISKNWKTTVLIASVAFASGVAANYAWNNLIPKKQIPKPRKWVRVGTVKDLMIYPIKSCKEIHVQEALPTKLGLVASEFLRDRVFIVLNSKSVYQTQRQLPRMALIQVTIQGDQVMLSAKGMGSLRFTVPESKPDLKQPYKFLNEHEASAYDCGAEVSKWLDTFLEQDGLKLLYHASQKSLRSVIPSQQVFPYFLPEDKGTFQDETSYLIVTEESVTELNTRVDIDTPVTYRNFRPCILIDGLTDPFAEDFWTFVRIGSDNGPVFKTAKPCTRCKLTTVNPDTGTFNNNGEPLKTLNAMKRNFDNDEYDKLLKNRPIFGLQMGLYKEGGSIKIGDPVYTAVL